MGKKNFLNIEGAAAIVGGISLEAFIPLWLAAVGQWGSYNRETGFFELNGLTDITFEQAVDIYVNGRTQYPYPIRLGATCRTNILQRGTDRIYTPSMDTATIAHICNYASKCEVLRLAKDMDDLDNPAAECGLVIESWRTIFYGAVALKKVIGFIDVRNITSIATSVFSGANKLEEIFIKNLKCNLSISGLGKLNYRSWKFIVAQASNTSAITVTVHADIYGALHGESASYPFNGGTQEEWAQLLEDATARNIAFAKP